MALEPRAVGALLVGAGAAGATTSLALLLGTLAGGASSAARAYALLFQLLVTLALAPAAAGVLQPHAAWGRPLRARVLAAVLLWFVGVGAGFAQAKAPVLLAAGDLLSLAGGALFAAVGVQVLRPPGRARRRSRGR
jgi:hypothetical protein